MRLLTLDEAADRLAISRRSLERLIRDGKFTVVHPTPRRSAIEEREVDAYIAAIRKVA